MTQDQRDAVTLPEIIVADYDTDWPKQYEREKARIVGALGDAIVSVEHIGSTAVPGLAAKPIIDIMVGLRALAGAEQWIESLEDVGYECCGDAGVPGRLFFRKGNPRSHHLNLVEYADEIWERTILFRDFLREHQEAALRYETLKRELAAKYRSDPSAYGVAKAPYVEAMLARVRPTGARASHD